MDRLLLILIQLFELLAVGGIWLGAWTAVHALRV